MDDPVEEKEEFPNLPEELRGKDLTPDETEKLKNDFSVSKERIIITFSSNQTKELAEFLGMPVLNPRRKNLYTFEEIKSIAENGLLN